MKQPIDHLLIREGDLIRAERGEEACEYRALAVGHHFGRRRKHYLLDRPRPLVPLPARPTLGRLKWRKPGAGPDGEPFKERSVVAVWRLGDSVSGGGARQVLSEDNSFQVRHEHVTEWQPLTVVPCDALHDQPEPDVELPERATIGWVVGESGREHFLAYWDGRRIVDFGQNYRHYERHEVESFTPAVAVPADALAEFRDFLTSAVPAHWGAERCWTEVCVAGKRLLAAVDEANEALS